MWLNITRYDVPLKNFETDVMHVCSVRDFWALINHHAMQGWREIALRIRARVDGCALK